MSRDADGLRARALALGASDAVVITPEQVVTAEWVRMKCLYGGCTSGRCLTCPPISPGPEETRRLLGEYETILLLRFDVRPERVEWLLASRRVADVALGLERELFLSGFFKAFAIAGGRPCRRAEICDDPEDCDSRALLRPGAAGCGIDVFTTSRNAGWPLGVVGGPEEPYHRFALVLVE